MKTKILALTLIALMTGITLNSKAGNEDTTRINSPANHAEFKACINLYPDNIIKFQVEKPEHDKVKMRVYDENGIKLFTYIMKKENVARIGFNVSMLKPGKYQYVIERNGEEYLRKTIEKVN